MSYILYKPNGQIVSIVKCSQTHPDNDGGYSVLPDTTCLDSENYFVVDGLLTLKPAKPSSYASFNYSTHVWEDLRDLIDVKRAKELYINTARANANQTYFVFQGVQISVDPLSRSDIDAVNGEISLTGSLPASWPGAWKAKDNTYVSIPDVDTWTLFYKAMTAQGTANFMQAQALKAQVAAATTIAEVEAIIWP